ncbi:MAG: hypothetical protein GF317_10190 [Candidatus Lokiarchaeota archaeon]|nr:hypothetical protein [Candidatus Lokiarchaeota archaeon]MBD3200029.1 hypothetical protein [Candidatus Lokiarchaeota archaeon]
MNDQEQEGKKMTDSLENSSIEFEKIRFSEETENCFGCGEKLPKKNIDKCPYCGIILKD